jgi:hypothetical protein
MRRPTTEAEAIEIIEAAMYVMWGQIEYERGSRRRSWNGAFVDHCKNEMTHALAWLADRYPRPMSPVEEKTNEVH